MELYLFLFASLLFCLILAKTKSKSSSKPKLPPGPVPLPIIGNVHQLYKGQTHVILKDLANKYGPLMHLKIGEISIIVVSSPEIAQEIFKTHDLVFSDRPSNVVAFEIASYNCLDMVLCPYGNYWRQLRKICMTELLSLKRVQSFRSIREEETLDLIKSIFLQSSSSSVINVSKKIFSLTFGITSRTAFGKRNKNQEEFIRLEEELTKAAGEVCIADMFPSLKFLRVISPLRYKVEKIHRKMDEIAENILKEHKENYVNVGGKKEDLFYVLLNIQRRDGFETTFTDKTIKALIFDIFSAGAESSSTNMEWAMSEMIRNPRIMKRAQEEVRQLYNKQGNVDESKLHELKYLQAVIKETLRLHPSVPLLIPRECREECEINGYKIPAKARVMVNAWAIGRDPRYWTDPDKFNPDRFLNSPIDFKGNWFQFVPFGGGRRICPGILFALANIQLLLAQLLFHFDWKLPGGLDPEKLDMIESTGMTIRRKKNLYLIPVPYSYSSLKTML